MGGRFWRLPLTTFLLAVGVAGCDRATPQDHSERAQSYMAHGDLRSAIIEFKNALQKDPNLASARLALGEADLEMGDFPSALKELERALDLGADRARVMPALLEAKLEFGKFQEVLGALEEFGSSPRLDVIRGRALLMSGALPEATSAFRKAIAAEPKTPMAYVGLAQIALLSNDSTQAEALLKTAVEVDPRCRRALLARGDLAASLGRFDDGLASFNAAARLPGLDLAPELGVVRILVLQNKLDEANAAVDKVLARAPTYPMANYFKGLIAFQKEDYATAEKALRAVQQQVPDHPPTLLLLGTVKFRQGQYAEADSQIGRFLNFEPDNVSARRLLAAVRLSNNNPGGAVEALEPVAPSLHDPQTLALLGTAYLRVGAGAKATTYLQQAVDMSPDVASLRTQLALSMIAGGETKDAIAQLETAVGLDDKATQSDVLLILLRLKDGNVAQAAEAAVALTQREPKNPIGFNLLGAVNLAKKDDAAAIASFEHALAVDPGYSPAALNLAKIALSKGDAAGARARLKKLLERDPVDVAALSALAQMSVTERDYAAAKDYLERARSAHADALVPRIALARLALATNDPELARITSGEVLALDAGNADALALHAQALIVLGNAGSAEPDVNRLNAVVAKPGASARLLVAVASLQRQLGQLDRARDNLLRAVNESPNSADALVALIQVDAARGDAAGATAHLDELSKMGADATVVEMLKGDVSALMGNLDAAVQSYRGLAKQGNGDAVLKLAEVLSRDRKNAEAKAVLQEYLKAHPDDFRAGVAMAGLVVRDGNRTAAIARYEALNTKHPDSPVVLNNLAWLYYETQDPRAAETARRAFDMAPRNPEIADTLGWILLQQDAGAGEAVKLLESAAGANPKDPSIQYHLAVAYEKLNRRTEARRAVDRSLKSGDFPEQADAKSLKDRL
jgi:putative PEP-CTERM system TPR-repeat lipoprotein